MLFRHSQLRELAGLKTLLPWHACLKTRPHAGFYSRADSCPHSPALQWCLSLV